MARTLSLLFRRDPSRDRQQGLIQFEGYQILWPDGQSVALGVDSFCRQGQRLLGLGRYLAGCAERLIDLLCYPQINRDADMTRLTGHRVRRFCLQRTGQQGRLHFLDGTPTDAVFDLRRDEPRVLTWLGLPSLPDGGCLWVDLAARVPESPASRNQHFVVHEHHFPADRDLAER
jgi:hypothetical protein